MIAAERRFETVAAELSLDCALRAAEVSHEDGAKTEDMSSGGTPGGPPVDTIGINVRINRHMMAELDHLRKEEEDLPTRPEMIRRMLLNIMNIKDNSEKS